MLRFFFGPLQGQPFCLIMAYFVERIEVKTMIGAGGVGRYFSLRSALRRLFSGLGGDGIDLIGT